MPGDIIYDDDAGGGQTGLGLLSLWTATTAVESYTVCVCINPCTSWWCSIVLWHDIADKVPSHILRLTLQCIRAYTNSSSLFLVTHPPQVTSQSALWPSTPLPNHLIVYMLDCVNGCVLYWCRLDSIYMSLGERSTHISCAVGPLCQLKYDGMKWLGGVCATWVCHCSEASVWMRSSKNMRAYVYEVWLYVIAVTVVISIFLSLH